MGVAIIVTLGTLTLAGIIAMFASDHGDSHFDHMLRLYHERKLAKMKHELELEKVKLQLLNAPLPSSDDK